MDFLDLFTDPAYALYTISIVLFVPMLIFSVIVQLRVTTVFNKYSAVPCSSGISAKTYAHNFLLSNGVTGVKFAGVRGSLTDNFDPKTKVISLSDTVRDSSSIGAIGVACHEAGHAVQHEKGYFFSKARIALVPVVNVVSRLMWPIFLVGYVLGFASPYTQLGRIFLIAGLAVMGGSFLFALVTLPTEFDASRRALKYLSTTLTPQETAGAKKVLRAAAMTYVASFMIASLQFLRILALLMLGSNRRK